MTIKDKNTLGRNEPDFTNNSGRILLIIAGLLIVQITILLALVLNNPSGDGLIQSNQKVCPQQLERPIRPHNRDKYGCIIAPITLTGRA